jgi:hypothetical protein
MFKTELILSYVKTIEQQGRLSKLMEHAVVKLLLVDFKRLKITFHAFPAKIKEYDDQYRNEMSKDKEERERYEGPCCESP